MKKLADLTVEELNELSTYDPINELTLAEIAENGYDVMVHEIEQTLSPVDRAKCILRLYETVNANLHRG